METARAQPGQPRLRAGNHRVLAAYLRPAPPVDAEDENRCSQQGDMIGAQGEADGQVVNAEREPGDEELA
jgi:hypothetical protein